MADIFDRFIFDIVGSPYNPDDAIVADATSVALWSDAMNLKNVDSNLLLTKGRYRFTVSKPVLVDYVFGGQSGKIPMTDTNGVSIEKRYTVDALVVDLKLDKLYIDLTIIDNPIPLFVIWGAVAVIVFMVGAISVNSVLEKIEKIADSPGGILLFVIIGGVLLLPFFMKRKT